MRFQRVVLAHDAAGRNSSAIERAVILSRGPVLEIAEEFLPALVVSHQDAVQIHTLEENERAHIRKTLEKTGGVVQGRNGAAKILDVHPNTLRGRMRRLAISRDHAIW